MKKFLLAVFCVALIGCNSQNIDEIKGNTYVLNNAPEGLEITITFDAEAPRFHGKAVNGYFGNYQVEGQDLKVMPIASTMMAAPEPLMKAETTYFQNLQGMKKISLEGNTLTLSNDTTTLVFEKQIKIDVVEQISDIEFID